MITTSYTYITTVLVVLLVIASLSLWFKRSSYISSCPKLLMAILAAPYVRLLLPVEFSFTRVVRSDIVFPIICDLFLSRRISLFNLEASILDLLIAAWVVGGLLVIAVQIKQYRLFINSFRHLPETEDDRLLALLEQELSNRGAKRSCMLKVTSCVNEPVIYGVTKPTILLPPMELADDELRYIIGHELSHYFHGHLLLKWCLELLCATHWWFPPVYWVKRQIYHVMEIQADKQVLKQRSREDQIGYLNTLVKVCKSKQASAHAIPLFASMYSYGSPKVLKKRFLAVKDMNQNCRRHNMAACLVLTALCLLIALSFGFVLQPYYPGVGADGAMVFDAEIHFLVPSIKGYYEMYDDTGHIGTVKGIEEPYSHLPVIIREG